MKTLALILLLTATTAAQQPVRESFKPFNPSDAAYWAGSMLDLTSSLNKREANPLWRDSNGTFSPGKNLAFKAGLWTAFKVLESHYTAPKDRRMIAITKYAIAGAFSALAVRNFGVERRH